MRYCEDLENKLVYVALGDVAPRCFPEFVEMHRGLTGVGDNHMIA